MIPLGDTQLNGVDIMNERRNKVINFLIAEKYFNRTVSKGLVDEINVVMHVELGYKYNACPRHEAYIEDRVKKTIVKGYDILYDGRLLLSVTT